MPSTINAQISPFTAVVMEADDTGNLALQTANVTALTLTTSQNATFANVVSATSFVGSGSGLTNLNISNVASGTLAISSGGTNATTASAALSNLGGVTTGKSIAMSIVFG
jgi:hypothetical protein